jgi:hypothetical protein
MTTIACPADALDKKRASTPESWIGVHVYWTDPEQLKRLITTTAPLGVNTIIWEIDYHFGSERYPDLVQQPAASIAQVREMAELCRSHGVRLIPQFQILGHQSWEENLGPLLIKHPDFDEDSGGTTDYCHSWCPLHPQVNGIIFSLIDEIIDAFGSDHFHIGMDEIFAIGRCSRCRGKSTAELYAKAVNDVYAHLAGVRKQTVMMWGDRLLDASRMYSSYEASANGTWTAIDKIPKDIIICDWHYYPAFNYPSIPLFLAKGFRVLHCGWDKSEVSTALIDCGRRYAGERMLGHIFTTWHAAANVDSFAVFPPFVAGMKRLSEPTPPAFAAPLQAIDQSADHVVAISPPADFADTFIKRGRWQSELYPSEAPRALVVDFAGQTRSNAGDFCEMTSTLTIPERGKKLSLQVYLFISASTSEAPGARFFQLLIGERVLWEEDIAIALDTGGRWISVDVSEWNQLWTLDIIVRVVDRRAVRNYPTTMIIGPLRLLDLVS